MWGMRDLPVSVSEYSTIGGTTGYTLRLTRFDSSRRFSVTDSIFGEQSAMRAHNSLKRSTPFSAECSSYSTSSDHLLPKRLMICLIGHVRYSGFISDMALASPPCCVTSLQSLSRHRAVRRLWLSARPFPAPLPRAPRQCNARRTRVACCP